MMKKICSRLVATALLLLLVGAAGVYAQSGAYDLLWSTVNGGGTTTAGGSGYTLMGTAGQPDAGPTLNGGGYSLAGGFWPGGVAGSGGPSGPLTLYLPIVMK